MSIGLGGEIANQAHHSHLNRKQQNLLPNNKTLFKSDRKCKCKCLIYMNHAFIKGGDHRSGLVVGASTSCGQEFNPRPRQAQIFKTRRSGFSPWRSGLLEKHYDLPASVRIIDWLSTD